MTNMTNSDLDAIRAWLLSVLDDMGIDGVIFGHHVLDLLIGSKHSFDHCLDEKEQSIFSKIAPSAIKKKQKCSRRTRSFSLLEEMLWKKENAVSCLLDAVETKADFKETQKAIERVVDELFNKISKLNLTNDGIKASSDGDSPSVVGDNSSIQRKKRNKENYEDAFPSLAGNEHSTVTPNRFVDSVWSKVEADSTKSECGSGNSTKSSGRAPLSSNRSQRNRNDSGSHVRRTGRRQDNKGSARCVPFKSGHRTRYPRTKEFKTIPKPEAEGKSPSRGTSKPARHSLRGARAQLTYGTSGSPQKNHRGFSRRNRKRNSHVARNNTSADKVKDPRFEDCSASQYQRSDESHLHYAHLPSWMISTLTDISHKACIRSKYEVEESSDESVYGDEINEPGMPYSKRWYRDRESGLLTFRPLKSTDDNKDTTSSESSLSRTSSYDGTDQELHWSSYTSTSESSTHPNEIWQTCPPPSVWKDSSQSPVSRLDSVYKKELMSLGTEKHAVELSGSMWEKYHPIFQELIDMMSTGEEDNTECSSDVKFPLSTWPELDAPDPVPSPSPTLAEQPLHKRFEAEYGNRGDEFGLWKKTDIIDVKKNGVDENLHRQFASTDHYQELSQKRSTWPFNHPYVHTFQALLPNVVQNGYFGIRHEEQLVQESKVCDDKSAPTLPDPYDDKSSTLLVDSLFTDFDLLTMFVSRDSSDLSDCSQLNNFYPPLDLGRESLLFGTPSERFQSSSLNDDFWPSPVKLDPSWREKYYAAEKKFEPFDTVTDILQTLRVEGPKHAWDRATESLNNSVHDTVTENQAGKTSLTIGNAWQNISGIRPVNVLYSENNLGPQIDDTLVPSSNTHFRPIRAAVGSDRPTPEYQATTNMAAEPLYSLSENGYFKNGFTATAMLNMETNNGYSNHTKLEDQTTQTNPTKLKGQTTQSKFSMLSKDKSMQTSFGLADQQDMPTCRQFFLPRPPRANSR